MIHIYKGTRLTKSTQKLDHDEVIEVVEMSLEKAISQIREGAIHDSKTIIGLQSVYLRTQKG